MTASMLFLFLGLAMGYIVIRPVATLVHEAGHVLALRLAGMRGTVRVFLGSLGDAKRSWRWRVGRHTWAIHPSILLMRGGLTDYDQPLSAGNLALVALAGPLASLLLAAGAGIAAFGEWPGAVRGLLILTSILATMDVLLAFFHRYEPILLSNARITANDGQVLAWYLRWGSATDAYLHARWLFEQDDYAQAAAEIAPLVHANPREKLLYEYWIYALLMLRQPAEALKLHAQLAERHPLDAYDACLHALALEQTGQEAAADAALEAAIAKAPGHHEALNHRAYRAMRMGDWDTAWACLNRAVRSQPEFAAALNNRAMVSLGRMDLVAAHRDLLAALRNDHENPFIHRNLSLYAMLMNDPTAAHDHMESAKLLGLRPEDLHGPVQ